MDRKEGWLDRDVFQYEMWEWKKEIGQLEFPWNLPLNILEQMAECNPKGQK